MSKKTNQKSNYKKVSRYVSIENVIQVLSDCPAKQKPTNDKIIAMLENSNLDKIRVENSCYGRFNRGAIVECIVKSAILNYLYIDNSKISQGYKYDCDLNLTKRNKDLLKELGLENDNYEVKLITSLARGSAIYRKNDCKKVVVVDLRKKSLGCKLVNVEDLIFYTGCSPLDNAFGSISGYTKSVDLELLNEILGLRD